MESPLGGTGDADLAGSVGTGRPLIVVVSGPSGSGKTSVVERVCRLRAIRKSVSATTRPPRPGERDGISYHFLSAEDFRQRVAAGEFAEWAQYRSHWYGTPRRALEEALAAGEDVLLEIDVQGGAQIRARYREAVLVFVLPPNRAVLERRLAARGTEDEARRRERLEAAVQEIETSTIYDYVIVNEEGRLEDAAAQLDAIIRAEHRRLTEERAVALRVRAHLVTTSKEADTG
jgi:guanylate kinase